MLRSGRWAVCRPGRAPVEIAAIGRGGLGHGQDDHDGQDGGDTEPTVLEPTAVRLGGDRTDRHPSTSIGRKAPGRTQGLAAADPPSGVDGPPSSRPLVTPLRPPPGNGVDNLGHATCSGIARPAPSPASSEPRGTGFPLWDACTCLRVRPISAEVACRATVPDRNARLRRFAQVFLLAPAP